MAMPVAEAALLEWALWYADHGHPVLPLHTPTETGGCSCRVSLCPTVGKHPRNRHGLTDATTDHATITRWWAMWPTANIGLKTGVTFWTLDVDPRKEGDKALYTLEQTHDTLPATPSTTTGGQGQHVLFALPPDVIIRNATNIVPGIDVRGEGGYIVAPPSLHASGRRYRWEDDLEQHALAQAPPWLVELCQTTTTELPPGPDAPIPAGKRNDTLSRLAFGMRKLGMSLKEIHTAIEAVNTARCTPPLDAEEITLIVAGKSAIAPDPILRTGTTAKNGTAPTPPQNWPALVSGTAILQGSHPLPSWVLPGLIPEGLTIIGGLPKAAKSYLAYELALACAGQGLALGHFGVGRGKAAYLAIEDDPGDTQLRLRELRPGIIHAPDLLFLHGEAVPSISQGLVDYLRLQVTTHGLTLVIVDPLSYVYDPPTTKQNDSFREAKEMLLPLRQLARELHFALVLVDHRRKQGKDDHDVFQTLYGSVAKYAVADALIMAVRREEDITLHCRGRKLKDQAIVCTFRFQDGQALWSVQGATESYHPSALRSKILEAFQEAARFGKRLLKVTDVADYAELEHSQQMLANIRLLLFRMYKEGQLQKTDRGLFFWTGDDDGEGVEI